MSDDIVSEHSLTDDRLRLMYEAYEQAGITTPLTKEHVIKRFSDLERGLPAEDEFIVLVNWLGKCELIHKLDQQQIPPSSRDLYQVPDLLAVFDNRNHKIPVLIEVKSTKKMMFDWGSKYYEKLKRYADLLDLPLLIAWKCRPEEMDWAYWTLFDSSAFMRPHKRYKMTLEIASYESLLGQLAGEFSIDIKAGVGLHMKVDLIGNIGDWQKMKAAGHYFGEMTMFWTDGDGKKIPASQMSPELLAILTCVPPVSEFTRNDTDSTLIQSFTLSDDRPLFTQHILPILLAGKVTPDGNTFRWRKLIVTGELPILPQLILKAAEDSSNSNIVNFVFHQVPGTTPAYLK